MSAAYLRHLVDRFEGDHAAALAADYQGLSSVQRYGWYGVTDTYVAKVFALRWRFRAAG